MVQSQVEKILHSDRDLRDSPEYKKEQKKKKQEAFLENVEKITGKKPVTLKEQYEINGKSYTVQQLKDMGYTEDQLKEAQANGTIK